ncbi:MAG: phage/plasmid primase, P4 family [Pusillimonas sp.]
MGVNLKELLQKGQEQRSIDKKFMNTDVSNAIRFQMLFSDRVKHVPEWGWLVYENGIWQKDEAKVYRLFTEGVIQLIYGEAKTMLEQNERGERDDTLKERLSHARRSASIGRIESALAIAANLEGIHMRADQFDKNEWCLNVSNGTIDLQTGELQRHISSDFITKKASVRYDDKADCPNWRAFLNRIFAGNQELCDFVQRFFGYSLTGSVREHAWLLCYGTGRNGKSTLLGAIQEILGDYADEAPRGLLLQSNGSDRHPTELASLLGKRLMLSSESGQGKRLDEEKVKALTGGDAIKARFMKKDFFTFKPTCKLVLQTNHKPDIRDTTYSSWARVKLLPFTETISDAEMDKDLPAKLKAESAGILNWLVKGCLEWQRIGLQPPAAVISATDSYRADSDAIGRFLDEETELTTGFVLLSEIYAAYRQWAESSGFKPVSDKRLSESLIEKGFAKTRKTAGMAFQGLTLFKQCSNVSNVLNSSITPRNTKFTRDIPEKPTATAYLHSDGANDDDDGSFIPC